MKPNRNDSARDQRAAEDNDEPCAELPTSNDFTGRVRNTNLSTTTTVPPCPGPGEEPLAPGVVECIPVPVETDPAETTPPTTGG